MTSSNIPGRISLPRLEMVLEAMRRTTGELEPGQDLNARSTWHTRRLTGLKISERVGIRSGAVRVSG
ncbi:MAG: hypothetical protein N3G18_04200 [Candidatus Saccharicenans sp.]|nr:hypothetical protein [Candidatus Saccharicenans sp.]